MKGDRERYSVLSWYYHYLVRDERLEVQDERLEVRDERLKDGDRV